ncbi:MAG TPA: cupin domain-containing protein [Candidatus Anoxymicrobiaceae bacterium]|jgi:mannose-6-phosphate isomerase
MLLEKSWGFIREYTVNQVCTVKVMLIAAGQSTSLHYHRLRDDMWIILDNGLEVQVGNEKFFPREGDEFVIKAEVEHKITAGDKPVRVLEIDFGYSTEDDVSYLEPSAGVESSD